MNAAAYLIALPIRLYRYLISPLTLPSCRYLPTCSDYALEALNRHGAIAGAWLAALRFFRCHPWAGSGYDPVPARAPGRRSGQRPDVV